jgi:hypothetical protein
LASLPGLATQTRSRANYLTSRNDTIHGTNSVDCRFWHARRLVVQCIALIPRQSVLAGGQRRLPQPPIVGQHTDDTKDSDSTVLRVIARRHTGWWAADTTSLQHWTARTARLRHQPVTTHCKYKVGLGLHLLCRPFQISSRQVVAN